MSANKEIEMSLKAKVAGIAVAVGFVVAGFSTGASASPDPVKAVMSRVNTQVVQRVNRTLDDVEKAAEELGIHIRF